MVMKGARALVHLSTGRRRLSRAFPQAVLAAVEAAVRRAESGHRGELRFAVEASLDPRPLWSDQTARDRAVDVFSMLRVWDTEHNNGVLIYVLLADRAVEIVADRGIAHRVAQAEWDAICARMREAYARGDYECGSVEGIGAIGEVLARHFPAAASGRNELPDDPIVL
jgi:uncharacterized membrane protein